ncbi:MAG: NADH-quinone oxidoreductase subunit H [Phycisphaerae bacterium]
MIQNLVHMLLLIAMPPLLLGIINKTKALFAGRVGPPVLQPYYDLLRLFRKSMVTSGTATWVFAAGPVAGVVTAVLAGMLLPLSGPQAPFHFAGDFILFAYLLGLGRFLTAVSALDTGSSFEGMGAAREVTFAALAEVVLFFSLLVLARLAGQLSFSDMLAGGLFSTWTSANAALVLVLASLFIVLLAENCRIPFDDPNTHLELTMIHEVMVLDHNGPALGLVTYGAAVKLFILGALVLRVAVPLPTGSMLLDPMLFVAGIVVVAVIVGVVESVMARLRLAHVPNLLIAGGLLSGFGLLLALRGS